MNFPRTSDELKRCPKCGELKPREAFASRKNTKDGLQYKCRACAAEYERERRKNGDQWREDRQRGAQESLDLAIRGLKRCDSCNEIKSIDDFNRLPDAADGKRRQCSECQASNRLKAIYGLTLDDYERILAEQDGMCANPGCFNSPEPGDKRFPVDHDHGCCPGEKSCGKCIRGILCHGCNITLGHLRNDGWRIRGLADYVENHTIATMVRLSGAEDLIDLALSALGDSGATD